MSKTTKAICLLFPLSTFLSYEVLIFAEIIEGLGGHTLAITAIVFLQLVGMLYATSVLERKSG